MCWSLARDGDHEHAEAQVHGGAWLGMKAYPGISRLLQESTAVCEGPAAGSMAGLRELLCALGCQAALCLPLLTGLWRPSGHVPGESCGDGAELSRRVPEVGQELSMSSGVILVGSIKG